MIRSVRRISIVAALTLVTVGALANISSANNFSGNTGSRSNCDAGYTGLPNMADPNPHSFHYSDLQVMSPAMANTRITDYDPTAVDTIYQDPVQFNTDVVGLEGEYIGYCDINWDTDPEFNVVGLTTCVAILANGKCDQHYIRYDYPDVAGFSVTQRYNVACHETGHTLGLLHRRAPADPGCMKPFVTNHESLTDHDRHHLNNKY